MKKLTLTLAFVASTIGASAIAQSGDASLDLDGLSADQRAALVKVLSGLPGQ